MTLPRRVLINAEATPYYHCVSRCVRRAYLCGQDALTGYDFDHRRGWIEKRLQFLAGVFAIDVCAYAVMSNHYHLVLHINSDELKSLDDAGVVARWGKLQRVPEWYGQAGMDEERCTALVSQWRQRLGSISWFMKSLNEPLARMANKEDDCKGRFWEGRFRSQALLDETAVLKCMAYVDLNPIRAKLAATVEDSAHTSVQARLQGRDMALAPMEDQASDRFRLPIVEADYLALVDWLGRQRRPDKRGYIESPLPPIVERLNRENRHWHKDMGNLTRRYGRAMGEMSSLLAYRGWLGQTRLNGLSTRSIII